MDPEIVTLGDVLTNVGRYPWNMALYIAPQDKWDAASKCAVLDPNETDDPDEEPEFAKQNDLRYALEMGAVKDIVDNARQQRPGATLDDLLAALNYYYDQDAFIELA